MRIRSVKPEFFADRVTARWSAELKMFYVGLWCFADDEGRFEWEPALIRSALYPYDPSAGVEGWLDALLRSGRVVRYEIGGVAYGAIPRFTDHQHPNTRMKSKFPPPPAQCASAPHPMCPPSTSNVDERGAGEEGRGEERKGSAARGRDASPEEQPPVDSPFVLWLREAHSHFPNPVALERAWGRQFPGLDLLAEAMSATAKQENRGKTVGDPLAWIEGVFRRASLHRRQDDARLAETGQETPQHPRRMKCLDPEGKPIWEAA